MSGRPGEGWAPGIEPILLEDLGRLGIGERDQLFWDGRPIEIRRPLVLTGLQRVAAAVVTIFAILGGLGGFFSGLNGAALFFCARNIQFLGCPRQPVVPSGMAAPPALERDRQLPVRGPGG